MKSLFHKSLLLIIAVLFVSVFLLISAQSQKQNKYIPFLDATVKELRFYESGNENVSKDKRKYKTQFSKDDTRYINWELNLTRPNADSRVEFKVHHVFYYPDGSVFSRYNWNSYVESGWNDFWVSRGWGFDKKGSDKWKTGTYKVDIFISRLNDSDKQKVASGTFEIVDSTINEQKEEKSEEIADDEWEL